MQRANVHKYVVGGLIAVVLAGLLVWLIRCEGERARQAIRDAREDGPSRGKVVAPQAPQDGASPAAVAPPARNGQESVPPTSEPRPPKPGIAAADAKPAAADAAGGGGEDFNLDDYVVFPGMGDEVAKSRTKPRSAPPTRAQMPGEQRK